MEDPRCGSCGRPLRAGAAFCPHCGAARAPAAPDPWDAPAVDTSHRRPPWALLGIGAVLLLVVGVVVLVVRPFGGAASGPAPGRPAVTAAPSPVAEEPSAVAEEPAPSAGAAALSGADPRSTQRTASASCVRPPGQDAGGNVSSYGPEQALDGRPDTAWRCDGDGVGQSLSVTFAQPVLLSAVGLIPGFAKTDPVDGTDRYAQNDRIAAVTLTVDGGTGDDLRLDTAPDDRRLQAFRITPVVTRNVVITIDRSEPGSSQGGQPAIDAVAISEVAFA